jgi:hypothetical protein
MGETRPTIAELRLEQPAQLTGPEIGSGVRIAVLKNGKLSTGRKPLEEGFESGGVRQGRRRVPKTVRDARCELGPGSQRRFSGSNLANLLLRSDRECRGPGGESRHCDDQSGGERKSAALQLIFAALLTFVAATLFCISRSL